VTTLAQALDEVRVLQAELAAVRAQLAWLKKRFFGGGQGETLDRAQLLLRIEALEKNAPPAAPRRVAAHERALPAPKRAAPAEAFAHLPVGETIEIVPAAVRADPALYEKIGEEETFEVDVVPPKLFRRRIVRPKYRHRLERARPPVIAPAPARPVPGGYVSAGLLAWITLSKYVEHQPLYRQEQMSARWGARIPRQTMVDGIGAVATWLQPIHQCMRRDLIAGDYVQCDETPIRCHDPDVRGETVPGWLWALSRPGGDIIFEWRMSRRHAEATTLLAGFREVLQSDAYPAYARFAREHEGVVRVGCWAHARRRFHEALEEAPVPAAFVLRLIGQLYAIEAQWDEAQWTEPPVRAHLRRRDFAGTLSLLKKVAVKLAARVRPKSQFGEACSYLLAQWAPLTAHLNHGQTRLDTNLVENAIRPTKLGAKNWPFIGHPEAGERSAIIYSIVGSCRRHGIDPLAYLRDVLTRLPTMTNQADLTPLLPSKWSPVPLTITSSNP
jgi:transposase